MKVGKVYTDEAGREVRLSQTRVVYQCCGELGVTERTAREVLFEGGPITNGTRQRIAEWGAANGIVPPAKGPKPSIATEVEEKLRACQKRALQEEVATQRAEDTPTVLKMRAAIADNPDDLGAAFERLLVIAEADLEVVARAEKNAAALSSDGVRQELASRARKA